MLINTSLTNAHTYAQCFGRGATANQTATTNSSLTDTGGGPPPPRIPPDNSDGGRGDSDGSGGWGLGRLVIAGLFSTGITLGPIACSHHTRENRQVNNSQDPYKVQVESFPKEPGTFSQKYKQE